jgi:hypothetical protein
MSTPSIDILFVSTFVALATSIPDAVVAQSSFTSIRIPPVESVGLGDLCGTGSGLPDAVLDRVSRILATRDRSSPAQAELLALEAEARRVSEEAPDDAAAAFRLAAVLGARTDLAEGKGQIRLADQLYRQTERVLALEPDHPGAHHILGRLNAAVMRLGGFKRFVAKHLFGGEVLDQASWDRARQHLEIAESADPCLPDHHLELAVLYMERGDVGLGQAELRHVLALTNGDPARWSEVRGRARDLASGH